ncbi:MAG: hypothetical protein HYZ93_00850 [Candidatus Omnitrophica bacterium]|nr:hypothetical protein [Candidatus Omnitrophota bacterium]
MEIYGLFVQGGIPEALEDQRLYLENRLIFENPEQTLQILNEWLQPGGQLHEVLRYWEWTVPLSAFLFQIAAIHKDQPIGDSILSRTHSLLRLLPDPPQGTLEGRSFSRIKRQVEQWGRPSGQEGAPAAGPRAEEQGLVFSLPKTGLPPAFLERGIPVFVQEKWRDQVKASLQQAVDQGAIRFVDDNPAEAYLVIGEEKAIPIQSGQVFIGVNDETVSWVTPGLLEELQQRGLLEPGSVVMLYHDLKESVLIFA